MKRFFIVNLFIATLFVMASCTSNTPSSNAVKFNRLIKQGKINEAVQMVRVEGADSIEIANHTAAVRDIVENRIAARYAEKGGVRRVKLVEEKPLKNGGVYIEVQIRYKNGTSEKFRDTFVQDTSGQWKATLERFW
ncbi:MAG: DUF4878 domain-containing protein [Rikenellaceae bacterium]|nr:DUF4878 domain-containing protein [Rikenellaceae bacterium]